MLKHVVLAPISFFNLNPIGRIINRFSKDMANVDDYLVWNLFELFLVITKFKFFQNKSQFFIYKDNIFCIWLDYIFYNSKLFDHFCHCSVKHSIIYSP